MRNFQVAEKRGYRTLLGGALPPSAPSAYAIAVIGPIRTFEDL